MEEREWMSGGRSLQLPRPPILRVPSEVSVSHILKVTWIRRDNLGSAQVAIDTSTRRRSRSRETSGGSVRSDLSMGNDKYKCL